MKKRGQGERTTRAYDLALNKEGGKLVPLDIPPLLGVFLKQGCLYRYRSVIHKGMDEIVLVITSPHLDPSEWIFSDYPHAQVWVQDVWGLTSRTRWKLGLTGYSEVRESYREIDSGEVGVRRATGGEKVELFIGRRPSRAD